MGDLWSARFFFFSSNLVGRIFFTAVQEFFSITFVLHAIFFFRQALAGNLFSKSPTPSLKSLMVGPLGGGGCFVRFSYFKYVTCCRLALLKTFMPCFRCF